MPADASSFRRTKIVCTIGPSSNDEDTMRALLEAGMDVARVNFSHGTQEEHRDTVARLRRVSAELERDLGILADLQGPKIRTGKLENGEPVRLAPNSLVCLTTRDVIGNETLLSTTYDALASDVNVGDRIYLADGTIELVVEEIRDTDVMCRVHHGGGLGEHKGINLPGVNVSAESLTPKDCGDLEFILGLDVDFVALSFVRRPEDLSQMRKILKDGGSNASVIAKIERPEAVDNFEAILEATDAIMLARGDLGVEVPLHEVPQIQKRLIGACNDQGVPVITATQMLESMVSNARPTRAEVADVANAIYDGTDAVMLSGETASGDYPVEAVKTMANIATDADGALCREPSHARIARMRQSAIRQGRGTFGDAIGQAACRTAEAVNAKQIVCFTKLGSTAALIARYRPTVPITAITLSDEARHRCSVIWGVKAITSIEPMTTDALGEIVDETLLGNGLAEKGDVVVLAGGFPLAMRTRTNMIKLHTVGVPPEEF